MDGVGKAMPIEVLTFRQEWLGVWRECRMRVRYDTDSKVYILSRAQARKLRDTFYLNDLTMPVYYERSAHASGGIHPRRWLQMSDRPGPDGSVAIW